MKLRHPAPLSVFVLLSCPASALAHAGERGFALLLPTGYYLAGGTLAVAASFALIALGSDQFVQRLIAARVNLFRVPAMSPVPWSILSFIILMLLVWRGFRGTQDPLENPLPLAIWTLWWVAFTFACAIFGNLWRFLNPWSSIYRLVRPSRKALIAYPDWLEFWPAVFLFFAFAWFELVDPAPDNPARLALVVAIYWAVTFWGVLLFGEAEWLGKAEPFSLFFRLISLLSPFAVKRDEKPFRLLLCFPGAALVRAEPLPVSGVLFVLLTLASVSFDGLSKTFLWLGLNGINPLEFPGRSAVIGLNTIGLLATWALLSAAYVYAVRLGWFLSDAKADRRRLFGSLVLSIVPIALAYHFAHYLTSLLVNGQYALAALLPFDIHVTTSFLTTYAGVRFIWNIEAVAIVLGHLLAITLAHAIAVDCSGNDARRAELPLAVAMVLYTLFGLWLLATPTAG
jgi:hypothetical protein